VPSFPLRRRDVTFLAATLVVLGGVWAVPRSLAAGDSVELAVAGPSVLTTASTYTITTDDDTSKICRLQETASKSSDSHAPYALTVSPADLPAGRKTLTFQAVACDNTLLGQVRTEVEVPVHIVTETPYVAPGAVDESLRRLKLAVTSEQGPLTARVTRAGRTVTTLAGSKDEKAAWTWAPGTNPAGTYRAEVTDGSGRTLLVPFAVTAGWAPLGKPFPRCTLLTWSYSTTNQPARAKGMNKDVAGAFDRISAATGIKFAKVATKGTIRLGWKDMGTSGPDGEGGAFWSGDAATAGTVVFNTRSTWVGKAGFKRYPGDFPGRGALITHEIGHALGLGHVTERAQVMYPVATNGSPLGLQSGDRAGLNTLYRAKRC
jgi:hypothetical protein